eukprot:TRINITY_DN15149_c0_g1_i1.p1 TRINITY_DN15149_c0_g1~~TRINITY_DN15149_c0_g1_i1.p1  ORF type:complete len:546 (+),score=129.97 TRINITY_DN15149_c0_g1_i1:86-1639(+)
MGRLQRALALLAVFAGAGAASVRFRGGRGLGGSSSEGERSTAPRLRGRQQRQRTSATYEGSGGSHQGRGKNYADWFSGDYNFGRVMKSDAEAFSLKDCVAPFRKLRLAYRGGPVIVNSTNSLTRVHGSIWVEAGKLPGVELVSFPVYPKILPDDIDGLLGSCSVAANIERSPRTWVFVGKKQLWDMVTNRGCSCGCGEKQKRVALLAMNHGMQQAWEAAGGAAFELMTTELPLLKCRPRTLPSSGPIRVCYVGYQLHGYDLTLSGLPDLLAADPRVVVVMISTAPEAWWRAGFEANNFTKRGVPMHRIKFMNGNGRPAVWGALDTCHVGIAPQWSDTNYNDSVTYNHPNAKNGKWHFPNMVRARWKIQTYAGRATMFTQLGIPVVTEGDPQTHGIYIPNRLGVTIVAPGAPGIWAWGLRRVLAGYDGFTRRACPYAEEFLHPRVEAAKLVCWLRHWQDKVERDPEAGVHPATSAAPWAPNVPPWRSVVLGRRAEGRRRRNAAGSDRMSDRQRRREAD